MKSALFLANPTERDVVRVWFRGELIPLRPNRALRRRPEDAEEALRNFLGEAASRKEVNRLKTLLGY